MNGVPIVTYEDVSARLASLERPSDEGHYKVDWIVGNTVALGRDSNDHHAIFLIGDPLRAESPSVDRAMRHSTWRSTTGEELTGNLISLPPGEHFRAAAATILVELLRHGLGDDPLPHVFARVEPLIELVMRRLLLPPESLLGLLGELVILERILEIARGASQLGDDPTAIWRGWRRESRDFVLGTAVVEVKTTALEVARHTIDGVGQVEPRTRDGEPVEELFLASVGLRPSSSLGVLSVAATVDRILSQLSAYASEPRVLEEAELKFLDRVSEYGPDDCVGYKHSVMKQLEPYSTNHVTTYPPRLYDMSDPNLRVLRRADLRSTCVLPEGLRYRVELPEKVPGSVDNPRSDLAAVIRQTLLPRT